MIEREAPRAKIRIPRREVAEVMARILQKHTIEDVTIEDLPLEEVIAEMFSLVQSENGSPVETAAAETT